MPRDVMIYNRPTLKLATTEAGLTAGLAVECQTTEARVQAQPAYNTIPATGCAGATQSPGLTGYQLLINWLQDWKSPGGGLSGFAEAHDGESVWFELVPDVDDPTVKATGQAYATAGDFGGVFGDGSAAAATATWPCLSKPDFEYPAVIP